MRRPFLLALLLILPLVVPNQRDARSRLTSGQTYCIAATPCVLTYHNDGNRDGVNPNESVLKASTLSVTNHPVPQWLASVDGMIYAQPLYIHQLTVNSVGKNVVFVATENNSVYSLDSDSTSATGTVLAQMNLNNATDLGSGYTEIAVPYLDLPKACATIVPEVGITSTPVIDVSVTPPILYVVTKHEDISSTGVKSYRQKLHGLYADTLQEIPGSPLVLDTTFAKNYAPGFRPNDSNQRAGLALLPSSNNTAQVWVAWGSHCDLTPYVGMAIEFSYNYQTQAFANTFAVFNAESACTKEPCEGGIWMGGAAPAVDQSGNVYLSTGNGADALQGAGEYSNSVVRLNNTGLLDFYSPPNFDALNNGKTLVACTNPNPPQCTNPCKWDSTKTYCQWFLPSNDWDLASGGVVLLQPTFALTNPQLLAGGKQGMLYNVFSQSMGQIDGSSQNPAEYACTTATTPAPGAIAQCFLAFGNTTDNNSGAGDWGSPAFLAGTTGSTVVNYVYIAGNDETLRAYQVSNDQGVALLSTTANTPQFGHIFGYPGTSPSVTWNQSSGNIDDAIVWALETGLYGKLTRVAGPAKLYAYRAVPTGGSLGHELWETSIYNLTTPGNPGAVKFVVPTIADGKVFVAGGAPAYEPGSANCPVPSTSIQPKACGGITMFK
jgi:hypothetical protein